MPSLQTSQHEVMKYSRKMILLALVRQIILKGNPNHPRMLYGESRCVGQHPEEAGNSSCEAPLKPEMEAWVLGFV